MALIDYLNRTASMKEELSDAELFNWDGMARQNENSKRNIYTLATTVAGVSLMSSTEVYSKPSNNTSRPVRPIRHDTFWSPETVELIKNHRKITGGKYEQSNVAGGSNIIEVDPSWTYEEINNLMDGNVNTLGKGGVQDPAPYSADTILFTTGTYQTPVSGIFTNNISGIIIQGQENTFLQNNPQEAFGVIFNNNSIDTIVNGITFRNSGNGVANTSPNLNPANPNHFIGNSFKNIGEKVSSFNNVTVNGDNSTPSVIEDSNTYDTIFLGSIHNDSGPATSAQTAFNQLSNNTAINVGALWYGPVKYAQETIAGAQAAYLGPALADGNVMINSNGVFMPDDAYGGGQVASSNTAGVDIPDANLEYQVALTTPPCPQPEGVLCYPGSLQSLVGGFNVVADPHLNIHGRPLPGSPLIGDGKWIKLDGSERHYGGAEAPAGDFNLDGLVDNADQTEFMRVLSLNNTGLTNHELSTFDFNSDNLVNGNDVPGFYQAYQGNTPTIPAVSSWGVANLGILVAIAGSILLGRKRNHPARR